MNSRRSTYNSHNGLRKDTIVATIEISDNEEDYVATYSETTAESKTVSVTRTTLCYPLRDCAVQIPRIDIPQLANSTMEKSSDDVMVFDVSDDSALPGDVSQHSGENASQDSGDVDTGSDSECDKERAAVQKVIASLFSSSSESDDETRSADEGERLPLSMQMNYSDNFDGFDVNDNSKKVFSSNMMPFSYKEQKIETRSESSGIESISDFHMSSKSSSSANQSPRHRPNKVHRSAESSDISITSTSSSISSCFNSSRSSSSARSSSSSSISSRTKSTISFAIQSKGTSDSEQSVSESGSLAKQINSYAAVKEEKVTIKTELSDSSSSACSSPIKRKYIDIRKYFGETSTTDDDVIEVKPPKRKVAKRSPKSVSSRASNQRSISEMFTKLNSSF